MRRASSLIAWWLLLAGMAFAAGPRYVTGPPFFPGYQSLPIGWKQPQLLYFTDPGDLSASVNHAAADALVAQAMNVWNVPQASITLAQGGSLAEHASSSNVYLDAAGMEYPADVMSTNAATVPIAILYDTDGSVTDTLLGAGASSPSSCRTNSVTESVDGFDPVGYITHAVIVLNGRCTSTTAAQQLELRYKLMRVFGRVLGLAWSQANDNVFTGLPTPTILQAQHWPIMHPIDILCGPYSYQCLPNPFTLRPDDVSAMVTVYPNRAGATLAAGKQVSLADGNATLGFVTFPGGEGMAGVNVLVKRMLSGTQETWYEASGVTGASFRRGDLSPFVAAGTTPLASLGTVSQQFSGRYTIAYLPLEGTGADNLTSSTEPINPLYTGSYTVGPYGLGMVTPSGSSPTPQLVRTVSAGSPEEFDFAIADAAAVCGTGNDGTIGTPAQIATTGWWTATICGYGHASYFGVDVKPGRTFTVEATALDSNGLATTSKLMPVIGLFAPTDSIWGLPSLGVTPAAFQSAAIGTSTISLGTGQLTRLKLGVADERGDGRPDFVYQGRMFYAGDVEPAHLASTGGTLTITGLGFRTGNTLLVNGVAATVTQWSANAIVATAPTMAAAHAASGTAVDVEVIDRGTGATSTISGALTYTTSSSLPNAMILLTAPSGTVPTGSVAATPFAVRVVAGDGVTPVVGDRVVFVATAGSVTFGACGAATCSVLTDATGTAQTTVTPGAAGSVTLQAGDGNLLQTAIFSAQTPAFSMVVVAAPSGSVPVGIRLNASFIVRVYGPDGVTGLPDHRVTFSVPVGGAIYSSCLQPVCVSTTEASGAAAFYVTPTAAGPLTLRATDGIASQDVQLTVTENVDTMSVVQTPQTTGFVNQSAGSFGVRLVRGDGFTPDNGQLITFTAPAGIWFSTCASNTCQLYTNSDGIAGTAILPQKAGTYTLQATYGSLVQTVNVVVSVRTQSIKLISAPTGPTPVGTTATVPFTVQLLDYDGVTPLSGTTVAFDGPMNAVLLSACGAGTCSATTDGNGMVSTWVTPLVAGTVSVSVVCAPLQISMSMVAVAAADSLRVVTQPGSGTIYTGDTLPFAVQLLKPDGATPDSGKSVTFAVTNGASTLSECGSGACLVTTDANGMAAASGVAGGTGAGVVTAAYGSIAQSMSFTVSSRPDVLKLVSAPAGSVYVGDVAAPALAVQVLASDGVTPVSGRSVTASVTNGNATFSPCGSAPCTAVSDANGMVSFAVTAAAAGSIGLKATDASASVTASFTAVSKPDLLRLVSAPASGSFVGQAASATFSVQVLLADGVTPSAGKSVTLSVTKGSAALGLCGASATCTVVSDASGYVATTVTPLAAGTIGLAAVDGSASVAASFTAVARPDVLSLVSAPADGSLVGNVATTSFSVRVLAGDGSAASGRAITLAVTAGTATLGACGASICVVNADANGLASSTVEPLAAGTVNLLASDGSLSVAVAFLAVAKPDTMALVSAPAEGAWVGEMAVAPFTVRILKPDGSTPAAGVSVVLTVTGGTAMLGACSASTCTVVTDAMGLASTGVTPLGEGRISLSASFGALVQQASFTAVTRPDVLKIVSAPTDGAFAGDLAASPFRVQVTAGGSGAVLAGRSVTVSVTNGVLAACGTSPCVLVTDATGLISTGVTPLLAGEVTLLAVDGGVSASASFLAVDKPDVMTVTSVPANGSFVGDMAAAPFAVQIQNGGTAATGVLVSVSVTNARLTACGAASCTLATDAQGTVSSGVIPAAAGRVTLLAVDGIVSESASFKAVAKPDVMTVTSVPANGSLVGSVATAPFAVQVQNGGVAAPNIPVTVSVTNGSLAACGAASCTLVTDAQGAASTSVTPLAAGLVTLLAADGAVTQTASFTAAAKPDLLMIASVPSGTVYVGNAVLLAVRATLADGATPAGGKVILFTVSAGDVAIAGCTASPCSVLTDAAGLAQIAVTAVSAGIIGVSAIEAANGSNAVALSYTVVARPDTMVLLSAPSGSGFVGDTMPTAFAVQVYAGDGVTPASGRSVVFAVTGGTALLGACGAATCTVTTDVSGRALTTVTATAAGLVSLAASEQSNTLTAAFTAVNKPDTMTLVSGPGTSVHLGDTAAGIFAVRVLAGDGVTAVAGVPVVFSIAGRGAGAVLFGACGAASCTVATGSDGVASTSVAGVTAGALTLLATADASTGAGSVSVPFQVVTNTYSLNALDAYTYIAEGVAVASTLHVSATENGAAAANIPVSWTGGAAASVRAAGNVADATGEAAMEVSLGPLAAGATATVTACAWGDVCAAFQALGAGAGALQVVVVSGGGQAVTGGASLAPVVLRVTDGAGHTVVGAGVNVYQTVTALAVDCPAQGRCPAQPVLASKVTVVPSDAEGQVTVQPLAVAGSAAQTEMAVSVGTAGFATVVLTSKP